MGKVCCMYCVLFVLQFLFKRYSAQTHLVALERGAETHIGPHVK